MNNIVIRSMVALEGPSIWTYYPVLEARIDIGELEDFPSNKLPGFNERLQNWLPGLIEHRCSVGERGGFLKRLADGTWVGHVMEHVALELCTLAGLPDGFGRTRETSERGVYKLVITSWHEDIARQAVLSACDLVMAAINDTAFALSPVVEKLRHLVDKKYLGPSTAAIVKAAAARGIPALRLIPNGNLVQLGQGRAMRRIWTAESDATSAIAETISRDKDLTKRLLADAGVPVPEGSEVENADEAWDEAQDIGLPVCVKPLDGNHGRGVFIDMTSEAELREAFEVAAQEGSGVLVERFVQGCEHRLLVIGGKLVAANRSDQVRLVGDGQHSVNELIELQINSDPRRGDTELHPLNFIRIDTAAEMELQRQNLNADAVPAEGQSVLIQRNANHAFDVTDEVHPDTARLAGLAARVVGLDIAGIDLVCRNIAEPLAEQGGAIVEVNAGPSLLMHLKPGVGKPRPVGEAIVDSLFADGEDGRIPVIGISGTHGKTPVAHLVAHFLSIAGQKLGLVCSDGEYLGERQVHHGVKSFWQAGRRLLMNPSLEVAVIENSGETILREGLPYDRCQIGVVTNILPDVEPASMAPWDVQPVGSEYYTTWRSLYRTQIDVVLKNGACVLNAADPLSKDLAALCDGDVVFFAADEQNNALLSKHLSVSGKRAVVVRESRIVLLEGGAEVRETRLMRLAESPYIGKGRERNAQHVEHVLAALAVAWAYGLSQDVMKIGTRTFLGKHAAK